MGGGGSRPTYLGAGEEEREKGEGGGCRETGARVGKAVGEVGGGRWRRREARRGSG